jgi:hypothetical protein
VDACATTDALLVSDVFPKLRATFRPPALLEPLCLARHGQALRWSR